MANGGPPPPKSFARRVSFTLAAVGFVGFWAAAFLGASSLIGEMATGFGILAAMLAHVIGGAVPFAAPRGKRLVPVLLNAISLAIQIAVMIVGLTMTEAEL